MNNTGTQRLQQADREAIYRSEFEYRRGKGDSVGLADLAARSTLTEASEVASHDGARLSGGIATRIEASRQSRGGEFADLDLAYEALDTIAHAVVASTSEAHRGRVRKALDDVLKQTSATAPKPTARMMELRTLRKSVATVIEQRRPDEYQHLGAAYAETLLKIEAELAHLGKTWNGTMHVDNIVHLLPKHAERVGREAIVDRFKVMLCRYHDMHLDAALKAVDSGHFQRPKLITGRDIGIAHTINACHLAQYFPKGRHFIRAADRDAIDAKLRAQGKRVRSKPKPKTRSEIRAKAEQQRELEALMAHFGVRRETVYRWRCQEQGRTYFDKVDQMEDERARGITSHDPVASVSPEIREALKAHHGVTDAAIRQWKRRNQLGAKIAEYRRATSLSAVA